MIAANPNPRPSFNRWGVLDGSPTVVWDNSAGVGKVMSSSAFVLSDRDAPADAIGREFLIDDANAIVLQILAGGTATTAILVELQVDLGDGVWCPLGIQSLAAGVYTVTFSTNVYSLTAPPVDGTVVATQPLPVAAKLLRVLLKRSGGSTDSTALVKASRAHI